MASPNKLSGSEMKTISNSLVSTAYEKYYASGTYKQRYPDCNQSTFALVQEYASAADSVLDFGCGDGRYTLPLLRATAAQVVACDLSSTALEQLRQALSLQATMERRVTLVKGDASSLSEFSGFDVILALFGVLAHIPFRENRLEALRTFRALLGESSIGNLILSVPNGRRRFLKNQRTHARLRLEGRAIHPAVEEGDIIYHRLMDGEPQEIFYHMYTGPDLLADLAQSGFSFIRLYAESFFPEEVVTKRRLLAIVDRGLVRILPSTFGYGLLAVAKCNP